MHAQPPVHLIQYSGAEHTTTFSPLCAKVQMALHLKGLEFDVWNVGSPRQACKFNARGRVPILKCGEELVVDSTDILDFLEQRFPDPPLDFADACEDVEARMWEDWADEVLYFYGANLRWRDPENFRRFRPALLAEHPRALQPLVGWLVRRMVVKRLVGQGVGLKDLDTSRRETWACFDRVATLLQGRQWLVGGRVSRADLAVAAVFDQFNSTTLMPEAAAQVRSRPDLVAWLERVHQRVPSAADG